MIFEGRDGHRYMTAAEIQQEAGYEDVTPRLLREWVAAEHLTQVTRAELARALGRTAPADGDGPVRLPGVHVMEYVYRWVDVVRAETATRLARRTRGGRPRRTEPSMAPGRVLAWR